MASRFGPAGKRTRVSAHAVHRDCRSGKNVLDVASNELSSVMEYVEIYSSIYRRARCMRVSCVPFVIEHPILQHEWNFRLKEYHTSDSFVF